ncbi:hypothetical protein, partial [Candidatus Binatus sp.]|uniref:hypothetical protein n=1 Tax=Candidatus Binatus sp. TaxID=2811406 RepID=UPI003C3307B1
MNSVCQPARLTVEFKIERCQRRLKIDPLSSETAEVKLTRLARSDQRECEGDFPPRRSVEA